MNKKASEAVAKRIRIRDKVFGPESAQEVYVTGKNGYTQIPRAIPIVSQLINRLGDKRVKAGEVYQALWFSNWGQGILERTNFRSILFQAGHASKGRSAHRNWKDRTNLLVKFGFLRIGEHQHDPMGAILLIDPHLAVIRLKHGEVGQTQIFQEWYSNFESFCDDWKINLTEYEALVLGLSAEQQPVNEEAAP